MCLEMVGNPEKLLEVTNQECEKSYEMQGLVAQASYKKS